MFFFSSRRRHTRFDCDWSSDVCSSDLISSCELALRKPRSEAELREVLASNLEDLRRMAGIVADMLFLSQADRGQGARLAPWASLAALAHEVIDFHEAALQEADLQVVVQGDAAAEVDARLLRRALSNLLGNATRYAQRGSTITVQIGARPCAHHGRSEEHTSELQSQSNLV